MEILNQFGVNPVLLAAQVVNFLILLFILKKLLFKPVLKVLEERKQRIEGSLKNAEEIEKRLLETEEQKEKILAKSSLDAQKLMDQTKKELEELKKQLTEEAEVQAKDILKKATEAGKAEAEKMKQEVMGSMAEIVTKAMEKVSGQSFSRKDRQQLIEKQVKNLS